MDLTVGAPPDPGARTRPGVVVERPGRVAPWRRTVGAAPGGGAPVRGRDVTDSDGRAGEAVHGDPTAQGLRAVRGDGPAGVRGDRARPARGRPVALSTAGRGPDPDHDVRVDPPA